MDRKWLVLCAVGFVFGCDDGADAPGQAEDMAVMADQGAPPAEDAGTDPMPDAAEPDAATPDMASADAAEPEPEPDMMAGCTPSGDEVCDGVDNDCDDSVDEALVRGCWEGPAGTQGRGECVNGAQSCVDGDWGACDGQVLPSAELCDGLDNDCDGQPDEALSQACGPAPNGGEGECEAPQQRCVEAEWGECGAPTGPVPERCDGLDNDCDGAADEDFGDQDADGLADCRDDDLDGDMVRNDRDNCPEVSNGDQLDTDGDEEGDACDDDDDGDGALDADDCEPTEAVAFPGGIEQCDGLDGDCDGTVDEALVERCYDGPPETVGVGVCTRGQTTCADGAWGECMGQVIPAEELCDGVDSDCDGEVDEALSPGWPDGDGDGFGDAAVEPSCPAEPGQVLFGGDCDDGDPAVNPASPDRPDPARQDLNCDGIDGDADDLVFVDPLADPAEADGTREFPYGTIAAAQVGAAEQGKAGVALAAGVYEGPVGLPDGISLYGGYLPDEGWRRAGDDATVLRNNQPFEDRVVTLDARGVLTPTWVGGLVVESGAHPDASGSSYGVYAREAPALTLESVTVRSGAGGAGAPGAPGALGAEGSNGGNGGNCGDPAGQGGASACGAEGFPGGTGGAVRERGESGQPAGCGGNGGDRGGIGAGADGANGCNGEAGPSGADGADVQASGVVEGWWSTGAGADGQTGQNGRGGGGGGGGGGAAVIGTNAGGGGGGGAGGCGGTPGLGGGHGGGSFAVFAVDSPGMRIVGCTLQSAPGGPGGPGGAGGPGGSGGQGGGGGEGARAFSCGGLAGPGDGGSGGAGGPGGRGGHGRGGDGGPSFGLFCEGGAIAVEASDVANAEGGAGGPSPGNAGAAGPSGAARGCEPM